MSSTVDHPGFDPNLVYPNPTEATAAWAESPVHTHVHRRISWAAIGGGVILMVAVQLLWSLLGTGIGLGLVEARGGSGLDAGQFGLSAAIYIALSTWISLLAGGYVSGWLAGIETRFDGVLHGLIAWGIAMLIGLYLLTSAASTVIGGATQIVGSAASATGDLARQTVQATGVVPEGLGDQARSLLQPTNADPASLSPGQASVEVTRNLAIYARGGADAATAKQRVVAVIAAQQHISQDEATQRFNDTETRFKQARDKAVQDAQAAADQAAKMASNTSIATFGDLLIGAIAAALGGAVAIQRRETMVPARMI